MFYRVLFLVFAVLALGQAVDLEASKNADWLSDRHFYRLAKTIAAKANINEHVALSDAVSTNSLRRVEDESRFMSGFVSLADYYDNQCHKFRDFAVDVLNKCQNVRSHSFRVRAWVTQSNHLGITFDYWDQNNCVGQWSKDDVYVPFGTGCWWGSRGDVSNDFHFSNDFPPASWKPVFATYYFPSEPLCQTAHDTQWQTQDYTGWEEVGIHMINWCYRRSNGDVIFTGCDHFNGVPVNIYSSNNGTCTGFVKTEFYNPGNICDTVDVWGRSAWPDYTLNRCFL